MAHADDSSLVASASARRRCRAAPVGARAAAPRVAAGTLVRAGAGAAAASRRSLARRTGARLPRDRDRGRAAPAPSRRAKPRRDGSRARAGKKRTASQGKAGAKTAAAAEAEVQEADKIANQSIRVNVDTLEHLMTMVSELVLTRNQLLEISRRNEDTEFKVPLQRLSNVTAELQEGVMKTRMQPIGNAWQKLPRIVRDLSGELGKQIELEMHGADTELDRQVLDLIKDPLTHMVRNSADHGLETPAERLAGGKREQGTIRLSAYHEGGHIIICIADNGRGLNTERIKAKAISNGLVTEAELEKMTEAQIHKFIFAPGFSTAAAVTSVSGRGVGMDVVRTNIDQIGGTIDIKSVAGEGSSVTIKIPLTLAIVSALIVEAAGDRFAIPQLSVVELVRARANSEHRIERIKDTAVLRLRNKLLPLMHLKKLLKIDDGSSSDPENGFIVVTQVGSQTFGIVVDGVFHTEEIVVKPMSTKLRHIDMFSGNTILGDGAVIMIIDPNGIAKALGAAGSAGPRNRGRERGLPCHRRRTADLAIGVPRRLQPAQGGAARPRHPAGGDRHRQDRALQRPLHGAVPRAADAAGADERGQCPDRRAPSRSWCSPMTAARWGSWSTRSSTSSRSGCTSRWPAARTAFWARP